MVMFCQDFLTVKINFYQASLITEEKKSIQKSILTDLIKAQR